MNLHMPFAVLLFAILLLAGCQNNPRPAVPEHRAMPVLAPADFVGSVQLQQRVTGEYAGKQHKMLCVLEVNSDTLSLAALSPQGIKLFGLQYDGQTLQQSRSRWIPEQLQPIQVLNDIQLALWPAEAIIARLPNGWQLVDKNSERNLFEGGQLRAAVIYTQGKPTAKDGEYQLVNHLYGYRLQVKTLEAVAL
ncbi:DUF3261 domain-containing protein [Porticoccus sp. GXU_MW_L64]